MQNTLRPIYLQGEEMLSDSAFLRAGVLLLCMAALGSFFSCRKNEVQGHSMSGSVPVVFISPPGSAPTKKIEFKFQASTAQIEKLQDGLAKLGNGANIDEVVAVLGPPSRQELTSRKEKPSDVTGRLYYYDVRTVEPGSANVFDQQLVLAFDYKTGQLQQIMSSVPEIR